MQLDVAAEAEVGEEGRAVRGPEQAQAAGAGADADAGGEGGGGHDGAHDELAFGPDVEKAVVFPV